MTEPSLLETWISASGQHVNAEEWLSWVWQEQNRVKTLEEIDKFIILDEETRKSVKLVQSRYPMAVTPYYLALVSALFKKGEIEAAQAITKTFLPSMDEVIFAGSDKYQENLKPCDGLFHPEKESDDGMGEEGTTPFSFVSQLYPDRILLFVTAHCPSYCRYCFRRRKVILEPEKPRPESILDNDNLDKALDYIRKNPNIRDVILSGGEPLSISNSNLKIILDSLREINHVKVIRIDTKVPAVMPMRIDDELCQVLKKRHPIYMTIHMVHPGEITLDAKTACEKLADAGIPLGTYTPILNGVNAKRETLKELFWGLTLCRVRPYYLVQFISTPSTGHFKVPLKKSLHLLENIHGELSGISIPTFKVYVEGQGKIPLFPNYYVRQTQEGHLLKNWRGETVLYKEILRRENG